VAIAAAGCGGATTERRTAPPRSTVTVVFTDTAFATYDRRVLDVSTALAGFGRVLGRVSGSDLRGTSGQLRNARSAFARAVAVAGSTPAPSGLEKADRQLRAAWRDLDRAMRELVRAARNHDVTAFRRANRALIAAAGEAQRAGQAYSDAAR
jgi:hypothetical protein